MTQLQAMLCALAAFTGWVLVDAAIKWGGEASLSLYAIMAALGLVGATTIAGMAALRGTIATLRPVRWRAQLLICACSLAINFAVVIALRHLPLTVYFIIVLTAPLVIAALVAGLKHEILTPVKILCLLAGFAGVLVAIAPRAHDGHAMTQEWIGTIAAFVATFCFAAYSVTIRKIATTDSPDSIQFSTSLAVGIVGLAGCLAGPVPPLGALALLVGAALLNIAANLLFSRALHHTAATNVAQLHYTQIVTGALTGYLIWHEVPTWNLVVGSAIIVAAGVLVAHQAQKSESR